MKMSQLCIFTLMHFFVKKKTIILSSIIIISGFLLAQNAHKIKDTRLDEISGIAASRVNSDLFYVHNDSGGKSEIYAIDSKGKTKATISLSGVTNRDWEDIALGPGPEIGRHYIYVGEIGDNKAQYNEVYLYRILEPTLVTKNKKHLNPIMIQEVDKFTIVYEDGAKDCETLFIDPINGDIYLVSKREEKVGLYQIKAPLNIPEINLARRVHTFDFALAVAGDITATRDNIIIKTYTDIYSWNVLPGQDIKEALSNKPEKLPYKVEPQGEAVCWSKTGHKYFTISEYSEKTPLYLYQYSHK